MYFLKISEQQRKGGMIGITRSNVYCLCPKCGKTVAVDLQNFVGDQGFSLSGTTVLCGECTKAYLRATTLRAVLMAHDDDQQ